MTRLLVACPVVEAPGRVPGLPTWDRPVLVLDNTDGHAWRHTCQDRGWPRLGFGCNLGVAGAWNAARARAIDSGADYLALISSSVVWRSGLSQIDRLVAAVADPHRGLLLEPLAFHGQVWSVPLLEVLGPFDENFWPGYYEDNDWVWRLALAGAHTAADPIPKAEVDAICENARSIRDGGPVARPDFGELAAYYRRKWGGGPGDERYDSPFGTGLPTSWWPSIRVGPLWERLLAGDLSLRG